MLEIICAISFIRFWRRSGLLRFTVLKPEDMKFFCLYVEHILCAASSSSDMWAIMDNE